MKRLSLVAVAVSLAINAGALGVISLGIEESSLPQGQVVVTELESQPAVLANVNDDRGPVAL